MSASLSHCSFEMNTPTDKLKPMGIRSKETMDLAAVKAKDAVESTRTSLDGTADQLSNKVDDAKASVGTAIDIASHVASPVAGRAQKQFDDARNQVGDRVTALSNQIANYTEAEPIKAILIAAATGAALMAVLSMMVSRD